MKRILHISVSLVVLGSLATMASAAPQKKSVKKKKAPAKAAPARVVKTDPELAPMVGVWTMRDGEKPLTSVKMKFNPNGTFAFLGPNWKSEGKFQLRDGFLKLVWTSVDGAKVAPGTMKKDYAMADQNASFTIDKYTYFKMGVPTVAAAQKPQP